MTRILAVALMALVAGGAQAAKVDAASVSAEASAKAAAKAKPAAKKPSSEKKKLSLADARAQIGDCIANPAKMRQIIGQLDAADQVSFLAEVNEAISKMPGSAEAKAATYVNVNRAAVLGASSGNKMAMLAEVYATVPPEVLTVINENFAKDLLNRELDPAKKYTDEQFTRMADAVMAKVIERCSSVDNAAVREAFAILMLVRASGSSIDGLVERLIGLLPADVQNAARAEWIPAAMGQNQTKTYEPLLGSADNVNDMPANNVVISLVGPQLLESLLPNLVEGTPIVNNSDRLEIIGRTPIREDELVSQPPLDPANHPDPNPYVEPEPRSYQGQLP